MTTTEFLYETIHGVEIDFMEPVISNAAIDTAINDVTGFSKNVLRTRIRVSDINIARQVAMFFYYKNGNTLNATGKNFMRDHATVIHAVRRIQSLYGFKWYPEITEDVNAVSRLTGIEI